MGGCEGETKVSHAYDLWMTVAEGIVVHHNEERFQCHYDVLGVVRIRCKACSGCHATEVK